MRYYFLFLFIIFGSSCSKEESKEDVLIGDWLYTREYYKQESTYNDTDTKGVITFNEDETGIWMRTNILNTSTKFEWDLQQMDHRISISKGLNHITSSHTTTKVYEFWLSGDELTLTYEIYNWIPDPDVLVEFEQITLKKI